MSPDFQRILAAKAAGTKRQFATGAGFFQAFYTDIAQAVRPDKFTNLGNCFMIGNQIFFTVNIGTEVA